jgi:hypothetical protein
VLCFHNDSQVLILNKLLRFYSWQLVTAGAAIHKGANVWTAETADGEQVELFRVNTTTGAHFSTQLD